MPRWEYKVVALRDQQYTASLNEFGREGWELVSVITEEVPATSSAAASPAHGGAFPVPRALGRLEEAADKLTKLGADPAEEEPATAATSRLLWVFRRPLGDD